MLTVGTGGLSVLLFQEDESTMWKSDRPSGYPRGLRLSFLSMSESGARGQS